ncbi:MAG: hypothetical protein FWF04_01985, partial [Clostridiales bacterium]|nr:hypothetical protein [Clostridiales bacterium]
MKKTRILFIGLVMTLILLAIPLFSAQAQDKMPDPIDPQSWLLHRDMTWHDLRPNPVIDWMKDLNEAGLNNKFAWGGNDSNSVIVGGFVMFEYLERKFISRGEVGSDPLGYYLFKNDGTGYESEKTRNPVLDTYQLIADEKYGGDKSKVTDADFAQWWVDYLNKPQKVNNGVTISEFWRENSYGQWSVDLRPYGPFTIPYFEFETMGYCINSRFQTYNDVPPSFRRGAAASGYFSFDSIAQAMAVDEGVPFRDFDFFFLVHAGNAESGAWQEFGQLQFPTRKDIPYELGPGPRMKTVEEFFTDNPDYLQLYVDRYAAYPGGATFRANLDAYNALKAGGKEADFVFHLSEEDWAWVNGYNDMTVKNTRYVDFTSWEAAVSEWSHA